MPLCTSFLRPLVEIVNFDGVISIPNTSPYSVLMPFLHKCTFHLTYESPPVILFIWIINFAKRKQISRNITLIWHCINWGLSYDDAMCVPYLCRVFWIRSCCQIRKWSLVVRIILIRSQRVSVRVLEVERPRGVVSIEAYWGSADKRLCLRCVECLW